jgi:hypothetical protein
VISGSIGLLPPPIYGTQYRHGYHGSLMSGAVRIIPWERMGARSPGISIFLANLEALTPGPPGVCDGLC